MEKKRFKADRRNNKPLEVDLKAESKHVLIRLLDGDFCDSLRLVLSGEAGEISETIEAKTFCQLNLAQYKAFSIAGIFTNEKGFVEGDIYTGNWEEIVLNEVELSFSDAPFYYACDPERMAFAVGVEGESRMEITPGDEGSFTVNSTLVHGKGKTSAAQRTFSQVSDGADIIRRLYGRMKGRAKGAGFPERQEAAKSKLTAQFNKTISESFPKGS